MVNKDALKQILDIDPKQGIEILKEFTDMFTANAPLRIDSIRQAISQHEWEKVGQIAHSFKSSCAYVGALTLQEICAKLENTARTQDLPTSLKLGEELASLYPSVRQELHHLVSEFSQDPSEKKSAC